MGEGRALARAALLGNPSDGYGGRTLAFTFDAFSARVVVRDAERTRIGPLARDLLEASLRRFGHFLGNKGRPVGALDAERRVSRHMSSELDVRWDSLEIACETTIPRQVGLGGSSAIVIAALRALGDHFGAPLEPGQLAALALTIETEDLAIAAGPQDRVAQAHEGLLYMDFSRPGPHGVGTSEHLDQALLPPSFIAFISDGAQSSSAVHGDLRARFERGDAQVRSTLREIAEMASAGRQALVDRDALGLADLLDRNLEARGQLVELDPRHLRMATLAREHDAGANYAGSGGAIVGVPRDPDRLPALRTALADDGYELTSAGATSAPRARS